MDNLLIMQVLQPFENLPRVINHRRLAALERPPFRPQKRGQTTCEQFAHSFLNYTHFAIFF